MTDVNGLRLAYRGFIAGIAGAYVWVAIAMLVATPSGAPLGLLGVVGSIGPDGWGISSHESFVLALGLTQLAGAGIGIGFAYFFARFFTVRGTLLAAAICVAVLAWALLSNRLALAAGVDHWTFGPSAGLGVATIGYGLVLGGWVPLRGDVMRYAGSPST